MKKPRISKKEMERVHPAIPEAFNQLEQGRITRREFLRFSTLLGLSAGVAYVAAACAPAEEVAAPGAATGAIKRGGTFTRAMELQQIEHPARFSWVQQANVARQVAENLTETGSDNITRPLLLEKWEASDDIKTWTLFLNKGVKFNNGDELTADDILFNFSEWLNPDTGSSLASLMSYLTGPQDVEQVDEYTVRLHLTEGKISIPEDLFQYPALVMHRNFEGDFTQQPIGTGEFTLEEYTEGERAILKRRDDYWRNGADGQPLPYLDEITYVSMAKDAAVAAVQGGQVRRHVPAGALPTGRPSRIWMACRY